MRHTRAASPLTRPLGTLVQRNSTRILWAIVVGLVLLCVANKSTKFDLDLSSWIQRTSRVEAELQYVNGALGGSSPGSEPNPAIGTTNQLLLQTPRSNCGSQDGPDVLTVDALMIHLEAMAIATHVTVDLFDVTWSLKDLCYTPTLPDYEGISAEMLEKMIPCAIKTPLDCFWEGSKLLGPRQSVNLGHFMGPIPKWTSLNPMIMVEAMQRSIKNSDFPFHSLVAWMRRVGITTGYQYKPCLDPTDPNCPNTAPNKFTGESPNIGDHLTGGCKALAENQWHWKEEEIVGGLVKNKSGHIVKANALQSTIQLMGEQDMYDYWRRTSKVVDINNWSADKAKLILDSWQTRFKEELAQFTRTSSSSKSYRIHAMTSKLMQEPIDLYSLLDYTTLKLCLILMTLYTCISFPKFTYKSSQYNLDQNLQHQKEAQISRVKTILLAIVTSSFIGLTFIASLGLSSFWNLPFNMATTQILPPLALYYGFNQLIMIANIYSKRLKLKPSLDNLTTDCLEELFPIVKIESVTYIGALLVAAIIPIEATRVFAFQTISYIVVASFAAILLIPSIFTTFLFHYMPDICDQSLASTCHAQDLLPNSSTTNQLPNKFLIRKSSKKSTSDNSNIEEQIFSRIQDDLKNIKADSGLPTDINFSAQFGVGTLQTNIQLTTSRARRDNGSQTTLPASEATPQKLNSKLNSELEQGSNKAINQILPDLIASALPSLVSHSKEYKDTSLDVSDFKLMESTETKQEEQKGGVNPPPLSLIEIYAKKLTTSRPIQILICILSVNTLVILLTQAPNVKYGLQLRDIVARGTPEYEPLSIQERYFPVYNVFATTKGNFDYSTNQRLLHEFYKSIEQVDGIVKDGDMNRFWLVRFRSWLLEIQQEFDNEYGKNNKSELSNDEWTSEASEASKLAYKLLAQTGKVDNPVDRSIVDTNRLVDANGIINPKAFYYYLTAWVIKDPFTYAFSEANFKPEPKVWDDNPNNLRIERAKPLIYTQIPFSMKLSTNNDNLKTISEIRGRSQAFEQLNLPNFPTGIPFIFWDQFLNLDFLFLATIAIGIVSTFIIIEIITLDLRIAAIITLPILLTMIELYGFMGLSSIPFNNILAALLIATIGITVVQTVHYATYFICKDGNLASRTQDAFIHRTRTVLSSLGLFFICALTFQCSRFDFIIKYSYLLFGLAFVNTFNSLLLTPVVLCLFGSEYRSPRREIEPRIVRKPKEILCRRIKSKHGAHKKRGYPRVQSEISLSTISEEPQLNQSEVQLHDLKLDFSIKCY